MATDSLMALPFDQYQRYRAVQRAVGRLRAGREGPLKVLDVGGHAYSTDGSSSVLPIRLCLPEDKTVVLDVQPCNAPGYLRGDGAVIPFFADSFDVVVSCDTLEHVPQGERRGFLTELLRVSREYLVLIAPFSQQETHLADRILDLYISRTLGVVHQALREHLDQGLPNREEIEDFLKESDLAFVDFPSGYIYHWLTMMMVKHFLLSFPDTQELHRVLDVFYNRHLSDADERPPAYRHVFVVSKHGRREALLDIKNDHDELSRAYPQGNSSQGPPLLELLTNFLQLQREMGQERDLRELVITKDLRIYHLEALATEKDAQIAELRRTLNDYHERLTANHARLEATEAALLRTTEVLELFKKGRVVSTMMKAQELLRRLRGSAG